MGVTLLVLLMCGCRHIEQTEVTHKADTLVQYIYKVDSIKEKDSIFVSLVQKGCTIYQREYVYRWRDKIKTDTIVKTETKVQTEYIVKEVEKERNWWKLIVVIAIAAFVIGILSRK